MAKIPLSAMLRSYESSRMVTPTKPIHVSGTKIREECLNLPRGTPHRGKPSFEREREQGTPGLARAENSGSAPSPAECGYGHPCLARLRRSVGFGGWIGGRSRHPARDDDRRCPHTTPYSEDEGRGHGGV